MSILDEVMPEEDKHTFANKTTLVDGVQAFVPRTTLKPVLSNLVVGITTTPDATKTHYTVGDGTFAYHMFFGKAGMSLVDVIATAFRNVFLWVRPQGPNEIYYEPYSNRDDALAKMTYALHDLVGARIGEVMYSEYRDERLLEINKGEEAFVVQIRRSYDRHTDRITTIVTSLPERFSRISPEELFEEGVVSTVQVVPSFIDPGDFMPGVWTPDPNAEADGEAM
jgi:hypothetical protein